MSLVSFKKGLLAKLPAQKAEGTFYITTDERAIYLDVDASTRIRLGDFQEFANVTALEANPNPSTTALYYIADINCLAKWNGSSYIQINKDTGMTSAEVTGEGNAVTAAVYSADGRKLTLTKGATFATPADVDNKISAKVGELKIGETSYDTVKAYVDKKAEDAQTAATYDDTQVKADIKANKDAIDILNGGDTVSGSVAKALKDAKAYTDEKDVAMDTRMDAVEGSITTLNGEESISGSVKAIAKSYADSKDASIQAAQEAVDALEAKVGGVPADTNVVKMISDMDKAYKAADTGLSDRITAIEDDYLKAADKTALQNQIDTLVGGDTGKSVRSISSEEVAKIVAGAPEAYDTLKEISDWISNHVDDAAAMNSAILALQAIVDGIGDVGAGEKATVVAYVTDAIAALNIGDYAKAADLTDLAARVKAIEDKHISNGANKVEASTTNGNIKIDGTETTVYTHPAEHTISEVTGLQDALDAKATPANITTEINKLDVEDSAVDKQFVTAVSETDGKISVTRKFLVADDIPALEISKVTGLDTTLSGINTDISSLQTNKADKATTLEGYGIGDAYTKSEVEAMLTWGSFTDN